MKLLQLIMEDMVYIKFSTKSISIPNGLDPHAVEINKAIELIDEKLKAD